MEKRVAPLSITSGERLKSQASSVPESTENSIASAEFNAEGHNQSDPEKASAHFRYSLRKKPFSHSHKSFETHSQHSLEEPNPVVGGNLDRLM